VILLIATVVWFCVYFCFDIMDFYQVDAQQAQQSIYLPVGGRLQYPHCRLMLLLTTVVEALLLLGVNGHLTKASLISFWGYKGFPLACFIGFAVIVALLPKSSRLISRWALLTRSAGALNSWMLFMVWKGAVISSIAWEHFKRFHSLNLLSMWERGWGVSGTRQTS